MPRRLLILAAVITVACIGCPSSVRGQASLVSRTLDGAPANHDSYQPRVSADGRRIVFTSKASDLVPGDTNGVSDIFLWDGSVTPAVITRVNLGPGGVQANGPSENPAISPNGSWVAWNSTATNLGAPPTGGWSNVYVREIATETTTWASRGHDNEAPNMHCGRPALSDSVPNTFSSRPRVVFECLASNILFIDENGSTDVFMADVQALLLGSKNQVVRISTSSNPSWGQHGYSQYATISADGAKVAFESYASNLVPGDTNHAPDVFVYNTRTDHFTRISGPGLVQANASSLRPAISGDGEYVAFESQATNLTTAGVTPGGIWRVFRTHLPSNVTTLMSVDGDGRPSSAGGLRASINNDGLRVSYEANEQIFVWEGDSEATRYVSWSQTGRESANGAGVEASLAAWNDDQTFIVWSSRATNLDDTNTGNHWHVYVRRMSRTVRTMAPRTTIAQPSASAGPTVVEVTGHDVGASNAASSTSARAGVRAAASGEAAPQVTIGTAATSCVATPDTDTLRFCVPAFAAGASQVAVVTYADGEVITLPFRLVPMALVPNTATDTDHDALPDFYELQYGLDPNNAADASVVGASGLTPVQARAQQHHPTATSNRYLAEGATNTLFHTRIALANPGALPATALLRYAGADATLRTQTVVVPAKRRATVDVETVSGMATAEFSTAVESSGLLIVDRTLRWGQTESYGSHAETAVPSPALVWYLAEGATTGNLNLFYLLQNPNAAAAEVRVRYLRPAGAPLEKTYTLPPNSRSNIWVDYEEFPGLGQALLHTDVSAVFDVLNNQPIIVERALYADVPGQFFGAGHESAGVTAPALQWFLAEGATGAYFDLFVLIANPGVTDAAIEATYLLPSGATVVKTHTVGANSRFNIWVDYEDAALADTAVSTTIRSTNGVPVIVERALWWPGTFGQWYEAHNSPGATSTGTAWALAEGEVGGTRAIETYILLANTSPTPGSVRVTLLFEDAAPIEKTFTVAARSRFNVDVRSEFAGAIDKRFGAIVESLGGSPAQIVVERAMYWDAAGQFWAAGTNALATKLR